MNELQTQISKVFVSEQILHQYTGTFEEFQFTWEGGKLYCRNTHQRDKKDMLIPINERLFKIDDQSQVEFLKDGSGSIMGIRLLWNDGWVDVIKKTK